MHIPFVRRSMAITTELSTLFCIWEIYRKVSPDLVHQIAMKAVLYGTVSARLSGVSHVINGPVGLGYVFTSTDVKAGLLKPFVSYAYKIMGSSPLYRVIVENEEDQQYFIDQGIIQSNSIYLIKGGRY
jgi:hypothetical protein